jgi:hypothetical protein
MSRQIGFQLDLDGRFQLAYDVVVISELRMDAGGQDISSQTA